MHLIVAMFTAHVRHRTCVVTLNSSNDLHIFYMLGLLAVGTRLPDRDISRFALEFSRRFRASFRSFISIHQVAPATALLLLLLMLLRAWFIVIRQVSQA